MSVTSDPSGPHVQAAFCSVLADEWARAGVTDAVVSPGSRSTPLVVALDGEARIRVHVVLDERSAGFVALGLGLATGRPAVVVTTSGTASVELHPAVVEASQAGVPLIAVTTDRPPELHHVGAPQTVEQEGLFAGAPRWTVAPGVADAASAGGWRSLASRCVAEASGGPSGPGPVHINLAFREPLLGRAREVETPPGRPDGGPWHRSSPPGPAGPSQELVDLLGRHAGSNGLIVAGADAGPPGGAGAGRAGVGGVDLLSLARRLGWPVLAEPRSGCRVPEEGVIAAADSLLRSPVVAGWQPDIVVRLGPPWASKVLNQWLAALPDTVPQVMVDPSGRWPDPERRASHVARIDPSSLVSALARQVPESPGPSDWFDRWAGAEKAAQSILDDLLSAGGSLEMSEPGVARSVLAGVPDGGQLLVSSSMPVRDVEWYGAPRRGVAVLSNRGANGIDGVLSTAIGTALGEGRPTVALTGDLAFLYDAGALLWAGARDMSLTVVVVDNDGGGIFSFLPQAAGLPGAVFERYWGTPHGIDPVAVAAAYGIHAHEISTRAALDDLTATASKPGVRIGVVRSDRQANVAVHDRIHAAIAAAI